MLTANNIIRQALMEAGLRLPTNEIAWQPLPGPQTLGYYSGADELFFGGRAGGGKTDMVLGLALTAQHRSIIFRREYKQLMSVIERTVEIVGHDKGLNRNANVWRNLPGGRIVEFGAMQREYDKANYRGRPHDFYGFDELCDFTESQYLFVIGWARSTIPGQRVRVVGAGNPPSTPEGEWVVRRWSPWLDPSHSNPAQPGELRWFAMLDGQDTEVENGSPITHKGEEIKPKSRTFIPARLSDNPYLASTDYEKILQSLPEPLRSQLLHGDFGIKANDDVWQVIPTEWVRLAQQRWEQMEKPDLALRSIGADVARGGQDKTVIQRLYGNWFDAPIVLLGSATPDGPAVAHQIMQAWNNEAPILVDVIGIGASAYDSLRSLGVKRVQGINNASASKGIDRSGKYGFVNIRAESYWKLREALDPASGDDLALPPDRELLADLCAARYKIVGARIQIEPKEDIKARIGRSPDKGDALVLAKYVDNMPKVSFDIW